MSADVAERATALSSEGRRWDAVTEILRAEGYSKVDCIRATVEVLRLPLADAKRLVHDSEVWSDVRNVDEQWHDTLIAELQAEAHPGRSKNAWLTDYSINEPREIDVGDASH